MKEPEQNSAETSEEIFQEVPHAGNYRLISKDGNFNIRRVGNFSSNLYEYLVNIDWGRFILISMVFFFISNAFFAVLFLCLGKGAVNGFTHGTLYEDFLQYLFLSIQTFTSVGYGHLNPESNLANILASFIAFFGLLSFAIATGLCYAKFSKPVSHILFSDKMIIGPDRKGKKSLQFRIVNSSNNQIIDLQARVTLAWVEMIDGTMRRKFQWLDLEIENIHLFPLNWTIVHSITKDSPLYNLTKEMMLDKKMEVLILIKGHDDTYSKTVHSKQSYNCEDLQIHKTFVPMYKNTAEGTVLDLSVLNEVIDYPSESYT